MQEGGGANQSAWIENTALQPLKYSPKWNKLSENAETGIKCKHFSSYWALGQQIAHCDSETEAINSHYNSYFTHLYHLVKLSYGVTQNQHHSQ